MDCGCLSNLYITLKFKNSRFVVSFIFIMLIFNIKMMLVKENLGNTEKYGG